MKVNILQEIKLFSSLFRYSSRYPGHMLECVFLAFVGMLKIIGHILSIIFTGIGKKSREILFMNFSFRGEPKTWYGVPGSSAEKLENCMKSYAPDLFSKTP